MRQPSPASRRQTRFVRILWWQAVAIGFLAGVATLSGGMETTLSTLKGGVVGWLPSAYFIWRWRLTRGGSQAQRIVTNLYQAEAGKLGLTVALFALVFAAVPPSNLAFFFSAYLAVLLMHWLAPWLMRG